MPILKQDYVTEEPRSLPTQILISSVFFFVLSVFFYFGVMYQQLLVREDTAVLRRAIDAIDNSRYTAEELKLPPEKRILPTVEERALLTFADRLDALSGLLNQRYYSSRLPEVLDRTVQPSVYYSGFSLYLTSGKVEIRGVAQSYGSLAKQLVTLSAEPIFSNLRLSNTLAQILGINFNLTGSLNLYTLNCNKETEPDKCPY